MVCPFPTHDLARVVLDRRLLCSFNALVRAAVVLDVRDQSLGHLPAHGIGSNLAHKVRMLVRNETDRCGEYRLAASPNLQQAKTISLDERRQNHMVGGGIDAPDILASPDEL